MRGARFPGAILIVAALVAAAVAGRAEEAPTFAAYPGAALYHGRNAAPVLATNEAREFATMVRDAARGKPNFDGHFIVATWGCGTDCEMGAIIDAVSGRVIGLPVVAGTPQGVADTDLHFAYRLDSRLLVMNA